MSSDSENDDGESLFDALNAQTRARVDYAFDAALASQDSASPSSSNPRIPVVLLPSALVLLDLPGDNKQILNVCRSAAERGYLGRSRWREVCAVLLEGDDDDDAGMDVDDDEEETRSRSTFITANGGFVPESSPPAGGGFMPEEGGGGFLPEDDGGGGGGFMPEDAIGGGFIPEGGGGFLPDSDEDELRATYESSLEPSSDEYIEQSTSTSKSKSKAQATSKKRQYSIDSAPTPRKRSRRTTAARGSSPLTSDSEEVTSPGKSKGKAKSTSAKSKKRGIGGLTADEQEHTQHIFSLFLPSSSSDEGSPLKRRIMISDIQRVAGLLKEKIKAEEIVEMLEVFSSSPDKSVGWEDFQKIMITTKTM